MYAGIIIPSKQEIPSIAMFRDNDMLASCRFDKPTLIKNLYN